jgi:hypothetical protein
MNHTKGTIGILTGGGDVPGLNPAIRAITIRAMREGFRVIGLRRGWAGLVDMVRDSDAENGENFQALTEDVVNRAGRTGGTFLHTSRTRPSPSMSARMVAPRPPPRASARSRALTNSAAEPNSWPMRVAIRPLAGGATNDAPAADSSGCIGSGEQLEDPCEERGRAEHGEPKQHEQQCKAGSAGPGGDLSGARGSSQNFFAPPVGIK